MVIGGPIVGFHFKKNKYKIESFSVVVGDECSPKYIGSRSLILAPGRKTEVNFFWQRTYYDYLAVCAKHGTFTMADPA